MHAYLPLPAGAMQTQPDTPLIHMYLSAMPAGRYIKGI